MIVPHVMPSLETALSYASVVSQDVIGTATHTWQWIL